MARLSGLQREVLKLYRQCVRTVKTKPPSAQEHWRKFIRGEFKRYQHLTKKDFGAIEHLIRVGHRRFEMLSDPQIKDING
ncbi:uncharacterized protein SPAPADRAFT_72684 [Spathaspora passalidarum NRRL Y-27907]|uniref:Complex 1 LYR protein domain-containing protein n=1 Tax=Spathaspora passalidarum (strain NRRL Y-27907 / 11-Y1) TaxID=619300 RepID=G3ASX0_SPAPN|nr:uncharacterized protein SPAPADRAFT_72684 [Spathaspora passalidarum NRRL Y-27907]EGW30751.1 hypothetical protein SPAPADRAFT_72684 [Spathaspora passalidarum NRRL Y-27907]